MRSARSTRGSRRVARPLPRPRRTPHNPLQGLALDASLAPALAAARVPVAAVDAPADYKLRARNVWGEIDELMLDATARIGRAHARSDRALAQVASAARHTGTLRSQLVPLREVDGKPAFTPPVAYPVSEESDFPGAARRARRDARRRPPAPRRRNHGAE
jgi:hypothetical protein